MSREPGLAELTDFVASGHAGALSKLSSVGDGLSYQAAKDPAGFVRAVGAYKAGLAAAVAEVGALKGARAVYSQALLATALN